MYTGQNSIHDMDSYDIIEFEQGVQRYYCVYLLIRFYIKEIITIIKIMLITMQYLLHTCTEPCLSAGVKLPNVPCLGISGHAATPPFKFVYVFIYNNLEFVVLVVIMMMTVMVMVVVVLMIIGFRMICFVLIEKKLNQLRSRCDLHKLKNTIGIMIR